MTDSDDVGPLHDCHCHLHDAEFDCDLTRLVANALEVTDGA